MRFKKFFITATSCLAALLLSNFCLAYSAPSTTDIHVNTNEEHSYYIRAQYHGVNEYKTASSSTVLLDMIEYKMYVEDTFPEGLDFLGFEPSEDGTFGGVTRTSDHSPCGGIIIDDTKESRIDDGSWNDDQTEYYYHGLHYYPASRKITYTIEGLQAGCQLDVGVKYRTPSTIDDPATEEVETRRDFYNHPVFRTSNGGLQPGGTAHIYIEEDYSSTSYYHLYYRYKDVPDDITPQNLPAEVTVPKGTFVKVAPAQYYPGYSFEWRARATTSPINDEGYIQVNSSSTYIDGYFTPLSDGETDDTPTYTVHYEVDNAPAWYQAPRDRDYPAGKNVSVDRNTNRVRSSLYEFSGWESDEVELDSTGVFNMPSRNVTLRGDFNDRTFTITYAFDGDLPPNANELLPEPQSYYPGDQVDIPENPIADGYVFSGWYLDEGFRMPDEDLTVTGRWRQVDGVFEPKLSIKITDTSSYYKSNETANFEITVENTSNFALRNVLIQELLDGAVFVDGDNYETQGDYALIQELPANSSIIIAAKYILNDSDPEAITNIVNLVSATGANNYSLATKDYRASVDFHIGEEPANANTGDSILTFAILIIAGAIASIAIVHITTRGRRLSMNIKRTAIIISIIAFGATSIIHICRAMTTYSTTGQSISSVYKITSSAKWIDYATAEIDIQLKSDIQERQKPRDVIYVINNSLGMLDAMDLTKEKLTENITDLLSNSENRAALISFNTEATVLSEFTSDAPTINSAVNSIETTGHTDYAAALNKVRDYLANYTYNNNRDLVVVLISNTIADYGEDAGALAYYFLKRDYPYVDIAAVQYQMWPGRVLAPYSDRQYFATDNEQVSSISMDDQDEYGFAIKRAQTPSVNFDSLQIDSGIDFGNFEIRSILSSYGSIEINGNHVVWDASGAESGGSIKAQIIVRLKDDAIAAEADDYHLLSPVQGAFAINGRSGTEALGEDITLPGFNTVTYEKYPENARVKTGTIPEPTRYLAYSAVEISDAELYNNPQLFIGWVPLGDDIIYSGRDYFVMNDSPVVMRPTYGYSTIQTVSDGKPYKATSAYMNTSESGFNNKLLKLAGNTANASNYTVRYYDETIKHFKRSETLPEDFVSNSDNTVSMSNSSHPVYIWVDGDTAYYYTAGKGKTVISSLYRTFVGMKALEDISGVADWNTHKVTSLNETFYFDQSLTNFDPIANWNTSNVTSLSNVFASTPITSLEPMRNWDFSKITSLTSAFQSTRQLADISAIENLVTSNVKYASYMFSYSGFSSTEAMQNWDVSGIKSMQSMLGSNKNLRDLSGLANWDVSNVTNMSSMFFDDCQMESLEPLRNWDVSNVTTMSDMFFCNSGNTPQHLTTLEPIYGWNVSSSTNKSSMFNNINLPLPSWY